MNIAKEYLLNRLESKNLSSYSFDGLSPIHLAGLYVQSALLVSVIDFLKDELWLQDKEDERLNIITDYKSFLTPLFLDELIEVDFLKDFLIKSGSVEYKNISKLSSLIEEETLTKILGDSQSDQKDFVVQSLKLMSLLFIKEENDQLSIGEFDGHKGLQLYRTFDRLDDLFKLDYKLDKNMIVDEHQKERLYQKSGVGVQSGYSTILLALEAISLNRGAKIVDLGSGYGRVGLVCSLLRPDTQIIGYEFVPHRVDVSNKASEILGLSNRLKFITQDLSDENFSIPDADIYYLYDPFTKETYKYVLDQIVEVSKRQNITIVTKGNAKSWFDEISKAHSWQKPIIIDEGNLCIYRSNLFY